MPVTVDTNRIMFPTQRRFNAAWREMAGDRVRLLPQVAREIMHNRLDPEFIEEEVERARTGLERVRNSATEREILLRESDLWWAEELWRDDGPYELIPMSREQHERAEAICDRIDPRAFPRIRPEEVPTHADTLVIAQALATGQQMLVTGNMRSIDHAEVNDWAARHAHSYGIEHPEVMQVQDETMPRMYAGPEGKRELCAIGLGAAWPGAPDATLFEVEHAFDGMLGAMEGARLGDTGVAIADTWRSLPDPETLLEEVRVRLPERMRASERRHPAFVRTVPGMGRVDASLGAAPQVR